MRFPNRETSDRIRNQYPAGARVELTKMDDMQAPPIGTRGTVIGVDDTASVMVKWDNGSHLNVVYGEDHCRLLKTVKTICYGKEDIWDSKEDAMKFFLLGLAGSEGSEQNRYATILAKLEIGMDVCSDEED